MLVSDFNFDLPEELIAQAPLAERDGARMLAVDRASGALRDGWFKELPGMLRAGDVLVVNDSRVIPARLFATRAERAVKAKGQEPSGVIEVLLTHRLGLTEWTALVRPGRKVRVGERLLFADAVGEVALEAEVIAAGEFGERTLRFSASGDFFAALERVGHVPLPPYIHRADSVEDRERYQTVFSSEKGSAAAPTAGLHFTPAVLDAIRARGVQVERVTLHVGLGTFQPVRVERVEEIVLHEEHYSLPEATAAAVNAARREGRRVVGAGTTTVRTLEHCAGVGEEMRAGSGSTQVFISPGYEFKVVGAMLTNFHLPQSTLMMLVSAFAGRENVTRAYEHAVRERYRFFSYGDCMFVS